MGQQSVTFEAAAVGDRVALLRVEALRTVVSEFDLPDARRLLLDLSKAIRSAELVTLSCA